MRLRPLALSLCLFALPAAAAAAEDCETRVYDLLQAAYPDAVGETGDNGELLRLPGAQPRWIVLGEVACKVWPAAPDKTLLAVRLQHQTAYSDEGSADLELLVADSARPRILARYREDDALFSDAIAVQGVALDTARYRLDERTTAFGVRVSVANSSRPNPYSATRLSLYVVEGDRVRPVLRDLEVASDGGEWDTQCAGEFHSDRSTLAVDAKRDHGYAGLILRSVSKVTRNVWRGGQCDEVVDSEESDRQRLAYDGRQYALPARKRD
ncbi:hypothetical protein [Lysobacter silvisoli]|uniref:hypothetical protein n=1 Tax=Lysobacter silvisoli TaxID=2293254 RepID=UPI0013148E47|nr:hypothetical protein [Lysobacter silvisoli]